MSRRHGSILWNYFDRIDQDNGKATCNFCSLVFSYKTTTANLRIHLKRKHKDIYRKLGLEKGLDVIPFQFEEVEIETLPSTSEPVLINDDKQLILDHDDSQKPQLIPYISQPIPEDETLTNQELKRKIDRDLLSLFIDGYHPFSLVEDCAFKKFAKWIPGYELPSKEEISNILIPNLYHVTVNKIIDQLNEVEQICLTIDFWTNRSKVSYIAITGHYVTEALEMKTVLLKCLEYEAHNSDSIKKTLLEATQECNVADKVNFVITNNSTNVKKAILELDWKHYVCYGHALNLIIQYSLLLIQDQLEKVKNVVKLIKTNENALEILLNAQKRENVGISPKKLIQELPSRWNSTLHMLQRFVELQGYICETVTVLEEVALITNEDWILFHELCQVLKPFEEATKAMCDRTYINASTIIVMTRCLKESCDQLLLEGFLNTTNNVICKLKSGLEKYLNSAEKTEALSICTFLDPRYKINVFSDQSESFRTKIKVEELIAKVISSKRLIAEETSPLVVVKNKFSPWSILDSIVSSHNTMGTPTVEAKKEVDAYLKDDILPVFNENGQFNCPLQWWQRKRSIYPNLSTLLKKYCNIVATSIPCEHMFTKTGQAIIERRSQLKTGKVTQLTYLNVNLDLQSYD